APQKRNAIVGIIRFSVLSTTYNPFKISKNLPIESYFSYILDEKRLHQRLVLLKSICLSSLDAQTDKDFKILIVAPSLLPRLFKSKLRRLCRSRDYLRLTFVSEQNFKMSDLSSMIFQKMIASQDAFGTFRIDDDDAVSQDFIANLRRYVRREHDDFCISLCKGYILDIAQTAETVGLKAVIAPNASVGLAYISTRSNPRTIFDVSDRHVFMHKRRPVIQDATKNAFVQTTHGGNDTGTRRTVRGRAFDARRATKLLRKLGFHVRLDKLSKQLALIEQRASAEPGTDLVVFPVDNRLLSQAASTAAI
ncbi:MAG TPA: glycosyltransferase, partial [Hansschlegelia sp.]